VYVTRDHNRPLQIIFTSKTHMVKEGQGLGYSENRSITESAMKFRKGQSGNPGGRPKVLGEVQELARQYAPSAIVELARLSQKAKSETARIAAIRELLDRGYGRPRQAMEITAPAGDPLQLLFEELDALSRNTDRYNQYRKTLAPQKSSTEI
jgi:hypothetical protein